MIPGRIAANSDRFMVKCTCFRMGFVFVISCNMVKGMPFTISFDLNVLHKVCWRIDKEILACKMNGTSVHASRAETRLTVYRALQVIVIFEKVTSASI